MEETELTEETTEVPTKKLSPEEIDLLVKGIRPEGMDFIVFKKLRTLMNKTIKKHLKGKLFYKSVHMEVVPQEDGTNKYIRHTANYIKEKEVK